MDIEHYDIVIRVGSVRLRGRLDATSAPLLKRLWDEYAERGLNHVLVDLYQVDFIDSLGISTLVNGLKLMRSRGGDLKLIGLQPTARSVFELMMLDKVFEIFDSEEQALKGF